MRAEFTRIPRATPCVVTGDFNTNAGSTLYRTMLAPQPDAASSLHNVFRAAHPITTRQEGTVHFFTGHTHGPHIDWILATSHFRTIAAEIDHTRRPGGYPSDHFPVTAILRSSGRPRIAMTGGTKRIIVVSLPL